MTSREQSLVDHLAKLCYVTAVLAGHRRRAERSSAQWSRVHAALDDGYLLLKRVEQEEREVSKDD